MSKKSNGWRKYLCDGCKEIVSYNNISTHLKKRHESKEQKMTELTESEYKKVEAR